MAEILTIVGLILDLLGVLGLFFWAPEKFQDPQAGVFFALEGEDVKKRKRWLKFQPIRKRVALISVVLIALGFFLQLLGESLVTDWFSSLLDWE